MSMSFSDICLYNAELELENMTDTLSKKARRIGFSTEEIAELHRVYVAQRKVKK